MENTSNSSLSQSLPIPVLDTHLKFNNFDVTNLDVEEVVNTTILVDTSLSMEPHTKDLNEQFNICISNIQEMHQAPKIFMSIGRFDSDIEVITGLQQVNNVIPHYFNPQGSRTRLYDACLEFTKNLVSQQQMALNAGILSKTIMFVFTDGADYGSNSNSASEVKKLIQFIQSNEATMNTFLTVLVGIGERSIFEHAQQEMGFHSVIVIDSSLPPKEIKAELRKAMGEMSNSVSSASTVAGALTSF